MNTRTAKRKRTGKRKWLRKLRYPESVVMRMVPIPEPQKEGAEDAP